MLRRRKTFAVSAPSSTANDQITSVMTSTSTIPKYPHNPNSSEEEEMIDHAERGLMNSLEARRGDSGQAVNGERAVLQVPESALAALEHASQSSQQARDERTTGSATTHRSGTSRISKTGRPPHPTGSNPTTSPMPNYTEIAHKMRMLKQQKTTMNARASSGGGGAATVTGSNNSSTGGSNAPPPPPPASAFSNASQQRSNSATGATDNHRRHTSKAHALLEAIQENTYDIFGQSPSHNTNQNSNENQGGSIFDGVGMGDTVMGSSALALDSSNTDQMITGAMQVESLFMQPPLDQVQEQNEERYPEVHQQDGTSTLFTPLIPSGKVTEGDEHVTASNTPSGSQEFEQGYSDTYDHNEELKPLTGRAFSYGGTDTAGSKAPQSVLSSPPPSRQESQGPSPGRPGQPTNTKRRLAEDRKILLQQQRRGRKRQQKWRWLCCFLCCNPSYWWQQFRQLALRSLSFRMCMPLTIISAIFFYYMRDPSPEFLPGQASISWWLLFAARQCLTLDLARLLQWVIIDGIVLSSKLAVRFLGPLLTLLTIQAQGWPFLAILWATLDLFLIHGTQQFQQHWLYWTGIRIFAHGNSGLYLMDLPDYTDILVAMIIGGIATAAKRTMVALYFGRRTFVEFKPRLEKILREIIVLSEVAELAMEAEILEAAASDPMSNTSNLAQGAGSDKANEKMLDPKPRSTIRGTSGPNMQPPTRGNPMMQWSPPVTLNSHQRVFSQGGGDCNDDDKSDGSSNDDDDDDDGNDDDDEDHVDNVGDRGETRKVRYSQSRRYASSIGNLELIHLLEHWEEPKNAMDKTFNASINDILKFRRALTFMDDAQAFGGAFGPAHNRRAVIQSAEGVFRRLMTLSPPDTDTLPFEALEMLAHEGDIDGPADRAKLKTIKRMFRPDWDNSLSRVDFVRACDGLYKKLRFFRASVGNASVIDHHLESIIDSIFYFVLILVLLSITGLNPWPLLVSISTLLVSISFAVGSSASKYIEGVLLIAVRRPYDLGDRIYIMDPSVINSDLGIMVSWFIEDINLFNTTVRYAATNETGTINNGAIANMRIVNGNRSQNAIVWFQMPFRSSILRDGKWEALKAMLDQYAKDHPRQWHSFSYCRFDEVHLETDKLVATIGFQHRSSWQDLVSILNAKADLMCYILEYGKRHGINYEELPKRQLVYNAGRLKKGGYHEHRDSLHHPDNIENDDSVVLDPDTGLRRRVQQSSPPTGTMHSEADDLFLSHVRQSHG